MRKEEFIFDARRNPAQNPKVGVYAKLLKHLQSAEKLPDGETNLFVSFTALPKLGINPKSKYNTPLGIYAYPADFVIDTMNPGSDMSRLPFAGDQPWANIFKSTGNVIDLEFVNHLDYVEPLKNLFKNNIDKDRIDDFVKLAPKESKVPELKDGGYLWYITWKAADMLAKRMSTTAPIAWNFIFRKLGVDGVLDKGFGVIHEAEPTQAVFFNPRRIQMIERTANKYAPDTVKQKVTAGNIRKDVLSHIRSIQNNTEELVKYFRGGPEHAMSFLNYINPDIRMEMFKAVNYNIIEHWLEYINNITAKEVLLIAQIDPPSVRFIKNFNKIVDFKTLIDVLIKVIPNTKLDHYQGNNLFKEIMQGYKPTFDQIRPLLDVFLFDNHNGPFFSVIVGTFEVFGQTIPEDYLRKALEKAQQSGNNYVVNKIKRMLL